MLLQIEDLAVSFLSMYGKTDVLEDVSIDIDSGEVIGIVGESGSGKSVTALSILGLLDNNAQINKGHINYKGNDLLTLPPNKLQLLRGKEIGIVFQEPMSALNPTMKIGKQISNVIRKHRNVDKQTGKQLAIKALEDVQINNPQEVFHKYSFQLSGGMCQRVVIALAMSSPPELLIADEPTTALDVTVQAEILKLMKKLSDNHQTSIMLITHDLGVVANTCDRIYVMYGGKVVENGTTSEVLYHPQHPYTKGLIDSIPEGKSKNHPLKVLQGDSFNPGKRPQGCVFYDRCNIRSSKCLEEPPTIEVNAKHNVACWEAESIAIRE
ncbi:ABC transporter ATP-binding protein [Virgibacillus litoralis]|uniref:Peptide/nickel transport system ATP-binding protein n=1 Tax=Virgibacillus litoralis TaxID=578221 RepID=A0ABS4HCF9_9BACI|nr:ABC transporter ATP-binding protein [Virgibacillus litoralis]MBP1948329.1 peptide/nickel transport system ATP-binding protein [Virgibacillus litoralis]